MDYLKSTKTLLHPCHPCRMEGSLFHIPAGSRHQRLCAATARAEDPLGQATFQTK
ncbi:hypothetical protein [Halobacillus litoralis]|uniref:hypothetical protein n=1 Tax=Halobacillus litoralis TaxID=45668 RepID=UPI001CD349EE|nr:hypothetical protein [Halobacillus litoralis]MCA1022736.1 hypothetical protein [Halobacillus litoralis]